MREDVRARFAKPLGIYSQQEEDVLLMRYYDEAAIGPGRFLDIGAYDGELYSNTRALALMRGWSGVCVEPSPEIFEDLSALYPMSQTSRVRCVRAAITLDFDGEVNLFESIDPLSTTETLNVRKFEYMSEFNRIKVPAMSLGSLLKMHPGPYDLVSVDTEGTSEVLGLALASMSGLLTDRGVICIEYDGSPDDLFEAMKEKGYRCLADTSLSGLFVKSEPQ